MLENGRSKENQVLKGSSQQLNNNLVAWLMIRIISAPFMIGTILNLKAIEEYCPYWEWEGNPKGQLG